MNEKEISEIRRRFRSDRTNISNIRGCYINESGEIIAEFYESLGLLPVEQSEEILTLLKKTLSGGIGKNLLDIEFGTNEVLNLPEHKLLQELRKSGLGEDALVRELCEKIRTSLKMETAYLILLAGDRYDVPSFSKSGDEEESSEVFSYFVCSICPVKLTKNLLGFHAHENKFCNIHPDYAIAPPQLGFMFPTFDDRTANIYKTLFYTRTAAEEYDAFFETVFGKQTTPMPAAVQKETFQAVLSETVESQCDLNVVKSVQSELLGMIAEHKEEKKAEPLVIDKTTVAATLADCGVSEEHVKAFEERFDAEFGESVALPPANLVPKDLRVEMANVTIKVSAECADRIQTRVIGGVKYIMIRADDDVEVNGVKICIEDETK